MDIDKNEYLKDVLESHKMKHVQDFVNKVKQRSEEIKSKLHNHYGDKKYSSFGSGSFAKHTAINVKFDIDIIEPFKRNSFDTLEDMFNSVYYFLQDEYKNKNVRVRKQKVSIGVCFPLEEGDEKPVEIDVVPGREMHEGDYIDSHDLNLYFNEDHWGEKKGTCKKTNIQKQISHISGKTNEREIIRLLKIWKKQKDKNYKSFVIELATIKALDDYSGDNALWPRLKYTMEYLRDNICEDNFHLYDPGNSNNDVVSSMDDYSRKSLKSDMEIILMNIESDPYTYLKYYFSINNKYSVYKEKDNGSAYPITPKRFG